MAFGSKDKGKQQENAYRSAAAEGKVGADTAIATATKPDELEQRRRDHVLAVDRWRNGESGPIDVRDMPGGGVDMALYNDAKSVHDANRIGRGVGTMGSGTNPNFKAALDKESELERHKFASGLLEQNVNDRLAANDAEMTGLYQTANARNMNIAGLQEGRYQNAEQRSLNYLLRPKKPNFFQQLAGSFASGFGSSLGQGAAMGLV